MMMSLTLLKVKKQTMEILDIILKSSISTLMLHLTFDEEQFPVHIFDDVEAMI